MPIKVTTIGRPAKDVIRDFLDAARQGELYRSFELKTALHFSVKSLRDCKPSLEGYWINGMAEDERGRKNLQTLWGNRRSIQQARKINASKT